MPQTNTRSKYECTYLDRFYQDARNLQDTIYRRKTFPYFRKYDTNHVMNGETSCTLSTCPQNEQVVLLLVSVPQSPYAVLYAYVEFAYDKG